MGWDGHAGACLDRFIVERGGGYRRRVSWFAVCDVWFLGSFIPPGAMEHFLVSFTCV
jgi:hypothetical protein